MGSSRAGSSHRGEEVVIVDEPEARRLPAVAADQALAAAAAYTYISYQIRGRGLLHTHNHTHTYICVYMHMYMYVCMYVCISGLRADLYTRGEPQNHPYIIWRTPQQQRVARQAEHTVGLGVAAA